MFSISHILPFLPTSRFSISNEIPTVPVAQNRKASMSLVPLPISSLLPHNIKTLGWCISTSWGVGGNGTRKYPNNLCPPHTLGREPKACHDREHSSSASMLVEEDGASSTKQIWRGKEPICLCLQLAPPFAQPFPTLTPRSTSFRPVLGFPLKPVSRAL